MNLNDYSVTGRFTRDPELKKSKKGTSYVYFTIAVDRKHSRTAKSSEALPENSVPKQTADFLDCIAYNDKAEAICKRFQKGDGILVKGTIQTELRRENPDDQNSPLKKDWKVIVNYFEPKGKAQKTAEHSADEIEAAKKTGAEMFGQPPTDDDIPF